MTDEEYNNMVARHLSNLEKQSRERLSAASEIISRFKILAASKNIILDDNSFEYAPAIGVIAKSTGIAKALLGPVKIERDKLISFKEIQKNISLTSYREGCFPGTDFVLMAHPCYRRGMHPYANWAPRFLDIFWQFDEPETEKYIALDEDRVRIDANGPIYMESDTWFGAPFNKEINDIKPGIVKLRPPLDLAHSYISFFFANAYCLDIKWSESDGIKSFQALEIKTDDVQLEIDGQKYFPARYLHAEFDLKDNCFRHFDGAIQLFTKDEYLHRRDGDFNMTIKNDAHIKARSSKLFKINGALKTENWVELCCHFFSANPLTFEYFNGKYPKHINDALEKIRLAQ